VVGRPPHFGQLFQSVLPLGRVDENALPMQVNFGHWNSPSRRCCRPQPRSDWAGSSRRLPV